MNTILLLTILIVVIAPAALIVYRSDRQTAHISRVPFGFGPDSDRVSEELFALQFRRRDCA